MNINNRKKKFLTAIISIAVIIACIGGYTGCSKSEQADSNNTISEFQEESATPETSNNAQNDTDKEVIDETTENENSETIAGEITGTTDKNSSSDTTIKNRNDYTSNSSSNSQADNTESKSNSSSTGSSGKGSGSSSKSSSSSSSSGSSSNSSSSNSSSSKPTHTHDWVEQTTVVTVPAVTHMEDQGWDEEIPGEYVYQCGCGRNFSTVEEWEEHVHSYLDVGDFSHPSNYSEGYAKSSYIHHENWVEVVDTPATTKTVGTGTYKCSICGATK